MFSFSCTRLFKNSSSIASNSLPNSCDNSFILPLIGSNVPYISILISPFSKQCFSHFSQLSFSAPIFMFSRSLEQTKAKAKHFTSVDFPEPLSPIITCQPAWFPSSNCISNFSMERMFSMLTLSIYISYFSNLKSYFVNHKIQTVRFTKILNPQIAINAENPRLSLIFPKFAFANLSAKFDVRKLRNFK